MKVSNYAKCQLAGWGTYLVFTSTQIGFDSDTGWGDLSAVVISALCGALLTHTFRTLAKKHQWLDLPLGSLFFRGFTASLVMSVIHVGIVIAVELSLHPEDTGNAAAIYVGAVMRWVSLFFIWCTIYFVVAQYRRTLAATARNTRLESALQLAELNALRNQLNPHFLFNALNAVRALIFIDKDKADLAITQLSRLLRYSLEASATPLVALSEELAIVDDYLALETLRLSERLRVERVIDPALHQAQVPVMLVQQLVENAVKHGITTRPEGGTVRLSVQRDPTGTLRVEVTNPTAPPSPNRTGIGHASITQRLALLFGTRGRFAFGSDEVLVTAVAEWPL